MSVPTDPSPEDTACTALSGAYYNNSWFQLQLIPLSPASNDYFRLPSSSASSSSGLGGLPSGVFQILILEGSEPLSLYLGHLGWHIFHLPSILGKRIPKDV